MGDDIHSIRNQIHSMMWDSAVYQSINEARAYAGTDDQGRLQLNAMVHDFIDRAFFDLQMMAIRRLLDEDKKHGGRTVISLGRLLDDIENHVPLLTRVNILAALGLPYDYEKAREEVLKRYAHISGPKLMGEDYKQCYRSEHAHKLIDALAGVTADGVPVIVEID